MPDKSFGDGVGLPENLADALMTDFRREHQLVNLIIRGCMEYRWAVGEEERAIAKTIVFNAFEVYLIERGMPIQQAGEFCESHIDQLMKSILAVGFFDVSQSSSGWEP